MFQKIRVLVQRRPSRRSILFAQFAPALKATLVSYCFSPNPEPRSCTPWPDSCTTLCPSLCDPGPLPQVPQVNSLLGPTIPQLCRRGNQTSYEIPTRSVSILVSPEKSEGLPNSLGSTLVDRLPACVGLLMSPMSLPTIQSAWAHNPVKQSVTLF